jgi:hypothetical protein
VAADLQKVAAMEEEMRLIVKKMRDYQTQDPQLFAHVWESVKKTQAPRPRQAWMRAGEDLIRTSIVFQNKQLPSPISISGQQTPPPVLRSEPTEVTNRPPKPLGSGGASRCKKENELGLMWLRRQPAILTQV